MSETGVRPGLHPAAGGQPMRGLHGQVVQSLGREIAGGRRAPGDTLDPEQLERDFGVSRTVVREALRVLSAKGLVAARPKRGTYVCERDRWHMLDGELLRWRRETTPDAAFLHDLVEMRRIVEPAAAALAAQRRSEADVAALEDAVAAMERAYERADADAATAADLVFHRTLLAAGGNELLRQLELVIVTALDARDRLVHGSPDWEHPGPQHRAVLDAVAERRPEAARDRMLELLDRGSRDAARALDRRDGA